jgi:hypothetical protein
VTPGRFDFAGCRTTIVVNRISVIAFFPVNDDVVATYIGKIDQLDPDESSGSDCCVPTTQATLSTR